MSDQRQQKVNRRVDELNTTDDITTAINALNERFLPLKRPVKDAALVDQFVGRT